ncbi:hypothetical protein Tco_0276468 [Tanacetum coccineum]
MSNDRIFCQPCMCERCRRNYTDRFCSICCFESGNAFIDDLITNSFDDLPNSSDHSPQSQYQTNSCELCGDNAHYGYDCPPQVPFVYNQDPCFNQNFDNNFPQTSPSLPQYLCCTRCGGPHETFQCDQLIFDEPYCENCGGPHMSFQCQPMNQNFYNSNSSGFDQFQPPQYPEESIKEFFVKHAQEMITTVQSAVKIVTQQHEQVVQKEQEEQAAFTPYWKIPIIDDDDDEYTIQYREYLENSSNAITPVLPIEEPDNSLSMGDEHLSTIPETESDEVTKSSVEDLVPIPSESEGISNDTCDVPFCDNSPPLDVLNDHFEIFSDFNNDCTSSDDDSFEDIDYVEASPPDSELVSLEEVKDDILHEKLLNINLLIACDLPSSDDFSPISIFEEKSVTFSNPLFDSNDDFTSSDNESLSDEDVPEDVKIYSNPLFEFNDEYIFSDVNPLFDEVLEDIECKDSYDSNLDESTFLVTHLSDSNKDECLTPSDDIELLLHHDPSISVVSILEGFTDEPPLEENDDLFDLESKENDWKNILYDAPIDDLIILDKVFVLGIHEIIFSPTYVNLSFVDRHYLSFTYVIRTFLPYFTYPVNSLFPLSSGSEDIIFDPDISAFCFSSLKPVAYECPMEVCSSTCFIPTITMI